MTAIYKGGNWTPQEVIYSAPTTIARSTKTGNYTFALADAGTSVESNSASALQFTVPPNGTVAFPINTVISVGRYGTGTLTLVEGSGVTIRSAGGIKTLRVQYSEATLRKIGTNEWWLSGDLG